MLCSGHAHVFIDCYHHHHHHQYHCVVVVMTSVENVPTQPHRSYLKFYCKHMSILQQTILTHVHNLNRHFFLFSFIRLLRANAERYDKIQQYRKKRASAIMILCVKPNHKIAHISCYSFCFFVEIFSSCFTTLKVIDDITFS